ncbi:MAG: ABC transporter ATP-binding protein [bacterium]
MVTCSTKKENTGYCAPAIIEIRDVYKNFNVGEQTVEVLKGITFDICQGDFFIIFGRSGCGKSTLLYTILGLEPPTTGKVFFLGEDIYKDSEEDRKTEFRRKHIGMVYQQSNWIKSLSVLDNVSLPLVLLGINKHEARERGLKMLGKVDMQQWARYNPAELSSGQQQKVAVARALVTDPEVIVADEPTGNLDYESGRNLMHLLGDLRFMGKTIIMVTHDLEYLEYAKNILRMKDGSIVAMYDETNKNEILSSISHKKVLSKETNKKNE